MSQPDSNNQTSKGTGSGTVVSYALPIAVFVFLVGGMGVWFARSSQPPTSNQIASLVQPTAANQETVATPPSFAVTLTPAPKNWHGCRAGSATNHGLPRRGSQRFAYLKTLTLHALPQGWRSYACIKAFKPKFGNILIIP